MDKQTWFQKNKEERTEQLKALLHELVEIDKLQMVRELAKDKTPLHTNRYRLEKLLLEILDWEKEEHDDEI